MEILGKHAPTGFNSGNCSTCLRCLLILTRFRQNANLKVARFTLLCSRNFMRMYQTTIKVLDMSLKYTFYQPRSKGDNMFGSVHTSICLNFCFIVFTEDLCTRDGPIPVSASEISAVISVSAVLVSAVSKRCRYCRYCSIRNKLSVWQF